MEEEVKRVKAGWDGEIRRMMDAMAERGLLVCIPPLPLSGVSRLERGYSKFQYVKMARWGP